MHSPTSAEEEAILLVVADTSLDTLFPVDGARGGEVRHATPSACASLSIMLMLLVGLWLFTLKALLSNTIGGQWCDVSREFLAY